MRSGSRSHTVTAFCVHAQNDVKAFSITLVLLVALAGCSTANKGAGLLRPNLPELPGNLASSCTDPGVRAQPVQIELARNRQALATCKKRHRDLVRYYDRLRAGLAGK